MKMTPLNAWALKVHRAINQVFIIALVGQYYLAGLGLFGVLSLNYHRKTGWVLLLVSVLSLFVAGMTRITRAVLGATAIVLAVLLQPVLVLVFARSPRVAALHMANALVVAALAFRQNRMLRGVPQQEPAPRSVTM